MLVGNSGGWEDGFGKEHGFIQEQLEYITIELWRWKELQASSS